MNFLEKVGLKKKKEEEPAVAEPKPNRFTRLTNVIKVLNQPMGSGLGFGGGGVAPQRSPVERQLGIPEIVAPQHRAKDFTHTPKSIPKTRQATKSGRPTPGVPYKGGNPW